MFFAFVIVGIALWNFLPKCDRKFLTALFAVGIFLRIMIFGSVYFFSDASPSRGEILEDSRLYSLRAANITRSWLNYSRLPYQMESSHGYNGYLYILALFYLLIGYIPPPSTVVIESIITYSLFSDKLINCLIGTLIGVVIFYIAKEIFNKKVAKIASILVVFFPSLFFWSMTNIRDPVNILLIASIILLIIKIQKKIKGKYFTLLFILLASLFTIRQYSFFTMLVVSLFSFLVLAFRKCQNKIIVIFLAVILSLTFFNSTSYGRALRDKYLNFDSGVIRLHKGNQGILSQRGYFYRIYDDDFLVSGRVNRLKFMKAFSKGWFYFMLIPFPWAILSVRQVASLPQMIIWYLLLPFTFIGILFTFRFRLKISLSLLCYILLMTTLLALTEGNIGSAMRHRDLVTPFYLIFAATGLVKVFNKKISVDNDCS